MGGGGMVVPTQMLECKMVMTTGRVNGAAGSGACFVALLITSGGPCPATRNRARSPLQDAANQAHTALQCSHLI